MLFQEDIAMITLTQCLLKKLITETEFINIIGSLNYSKAKDEYNNYSNFLREHIEILIKPITQRVHLSIKHSEVPPTWKVGVVSPIFETGFINDKNNDRSIPSL